MQLRPLTSPKEQYNMHTFSILLTNPTAQVLQPSTKVLQLKHLFEQKPEQVKTCGSGQFVQDELAHKLQEPSRLHDVHSAMQSVQ